MCKPRIELPRSFLEMPRWWREGSEWLDALPGTVLAICERWRLTLDGPLRHGSNAIAVPVRRGGEPLILRMTLPDERTVDEIHALRFWDGRGTVRLHDADAAAGASLLERLDGARSLATLPLDAALPIIARLMRRLAVPTSHVISSAVEKPPAGAAFQSSRDRAIPSTADFVRDRATTLEADWERLGRPFARNILNAALAVTGALGETTSTLAVNGDLHFNQVLGGEREPWLAVDPVLLRGDIAYDLGRILWSRLDELDGGDAIRRAFEIIVREAGLDRDRARAWVLYRTVDYWLWGLAYGLTEDPIRCARLITSFRRP